MPEAVHLVLEATERIRKHEAGATGLVPLGFMRDGGEVLLNHRVFIRDHPVPLSSRSRARKDNLMKVVLFWVLFILATAS